MISLYIHIPFCQKKCNYCSFTSFADQQEIIPQYLESLEQEIGHYKQELGEQEIKTIYFGGGTPNIIGAEGIIQIITKIQNTRNTENLAELSLEFNPYPQDQIYDMIKTLNKEYKKVQRVRYSFGIQSLDDEVLKQAGRPYNFVGMTDFLRGLREIKQENNIFNFDFIAFGKFKQDGKLRDDTRMKFFTTFVQSQFADSFSLYTLELHENSKRYNEAKFSHLSSDDAIMQECTLLKDIITSSGYQRYEISNFARPGCASIHNMVYRNMENYLGLGVSAASFLNNQRRTNTNNLEKYLQGARRDDSSRISLKEEDMLIESFFLKLRTAQGIEDIEKYVNVLTTNYQLLITNYQKSGLVLYTGKSLKLTDSGMDVSNSIITDLLQKL